MSFTRTKSMLLTTTTAEGVFVGTNMATISSTYAVRAVHVQVDSIQADLYVSYDEGKTYAFHDKYEVAITGAIDDAFMEAEGIIQALEEFAESAE